MTERMYHHLPVRAYTSRDWFEREQRDIFSQTWACAGFMEDVPGPGHYISVQAGLNNIFVVMGRDRRLRAFHNICRHRGTRLIRAVGKTQKALSCPYHDWTYDLEGNLISVPDEDREYANLNKSCLGLKPALVDIWKGLLFVHPDPDAGSIVDWFGAVDEQVGPHEPESLVEYPDARTCYEIAANWKIVVENYIDVYHLSHLHSNTLQMYDHAKAQYGFEGPHFLFWEPPVPEYAENQDRKLTMPRVIPRTRTAPGCRCCFRALASEPSRTPGTPLSSLPSRQIGLASKPVPGLRMFQVGNFRNSPCVRRLSGPASESGANTPATMPPEKTILWPPAISPRRMSLLASSSRSRCKVRGSRSGPPRSVKAP